MGVSQNAPTDGEQVYTIFSPSSKNLQIITQMCDTPFFGNMYKITQKGVYSHLLYYI
jgi:hypothetical protein